MKTLIIGGGSIGRRHLRNLQSLGYRDITVLKRKNDTKFEKDNDVKVVSSYDQAAKYKFDAVFVCTPTSLHNEGLRFAVSQGAHIFMEKPLIHDRQGLLEAGRIIDGHKKIFFIGFMLRFHPLVRKIKGIIDEGSLGKAFSARLSFGSFLPYWHPWEDYKTSYAARKDLGGGVINTITHELDLIQYFFGNPDNVYCVSSNFNYLDINVEEQAEAIFTYDDKVVSLHLDYLQKDYDRNIQILFKEGRVNWNWHRNTIGILRHRNEPRVIDSKGFDVNNLYLYEVKNFISLLMENRINHPLDFNHAMENTQIMLDMHSSAEQKTPVNIGNPIV